MNVGSWFVPKPTTRQWFVLTAVGASIAGCDGGPAAPQGPHYHVEINGGDGQEGAPGWELDDWLTVRVTEGDGAPASSARVSFQVTAGEGSISTATSVTTGDGEARTRWTLGPSSVRDQALQASVEGEQAAVTFAATALGPDEVDLVVAQGALGPLRGVVLVRDDGELQLIKSRVLADTLIRLPPTPEAGATLIVFGSANRPAQIAPAWTTGVDTVHLDLLPPVEVDIDFEIRDGSYPTRIAQLGSQLNTMEEIWEVEGMGLAIGQVTFTDNTGGGEISIPSQFQCPQDIQDAVQVQIISNIGGERTAGGACFSGHVWLGGDFAVAPFLLAHEVGHTFALLHQPTGLMRNTADSGDVRDGETYRAHFHELSVLNTMFSSQPVAQRRNCSVFGVCLHESFDIGPE